MPKRGEPRKTFTVVEDSAAVRQPRAFEENKLAMWIVRHAHDASRFDERWLGLVHYPAELLGYVYPESWRKYWTQGGVVAGFPDFQFYSPVKPYFGLMFELKKPGEKPRPDQLQWLIWFRSRGFATEWVIGAEAGRDLMIDYLERRYQPTNTQNFTNWERKHGSRNQDTA